MNKCGVKVHLVGADGTLQEVCEIVPQKFKSVSLVKLSESGKYLILGNGQGQFFYIYELFPSLAKADVCNCVRVPSRIQTVLFRGYTQTLITNCSVLEAD